MKLKFKLKKLYIVFISLFVFIFLMLFFLSSIVRWYVVRNSESLIGRKIDLAELHINYFQCSVEANNFVMYEQNKQDSFVSFDRLYINFDPWQMFSSTYAFSEISLENPVVSIVYNDSTFNFDDLLASTDSVETDTVEETSTDTTKYLVKNINISGGYIRYVDNTTDNITELKELGIKVPEISWNSSKADMGIDFILGKDGKVSLGGFINQTEGIYAITLKTENIDIAPYMSYAQPYMAISDMQGRLYTNLELRGNMNDPMQLSITGNASLKKLVLKDINNTPFCVISGIQVVLYTLDIGKSAYNIRSVSLDSPELVAVLEKNGTNFDRILAPYFTDTLDTDTATTDTTVIHYAIDSLIISNGALAFTDHTLNRLFRLDISKLNYTLTAFSDSAAKIPMTFSMNLNKTGNFKGKAVIDIVNTDNIFFEGTLANLELLNFSPYSEYYIARPITKGRFNYDCKLKMTAKSLDNKNNIKIAQLTLGKKTKDTTAYKAPIGLALYVLKDRQGNIIIDLPVSGDPSNPTFKLRKIIWNTLEEFLIKAATEPFNALGKLFGTSPETIKQVKFDFLQDSLLSEQTTKLDKISEIIQKKEELTFTFIQTTHPEKEKQMLVLQEAKQLFAQKTLPAGTAEADIIIYTKQIKDNDAAFLNFLGISENGLKDSLDIACINKTGTEKAEKLLNELLVARENLLKKYFSTKNLPQGTVVFKTIDFRNIPDEMKEPKFVIEVGLK